MTKQELLNRLKKLNACESAQEWAAKQPNMKTILKECPHDWRLWALHEGLLDFTRHCNWNKLNGYVWSWLLWHQPQIAVHCDWNKLDGSNWLWLLHYHPQFAKHCSWNKLSDNNWSHLLSFQPQLAKYKVQRIEVKHD